MALINYNTKVQFDFSALKLLPEELRLAGVKRPLIVTDKGVTAAGLVDKVKAVLSAEFAVSVFDGMPANPTETAADIGIAAYRVQQSDGVIGLGGGSAMDGAKAVAILATNDGPIENFAYYKVGMAWPPKMPAPVIVIPTTAGTGSEVARSAVLTFNSGRKSLVFCTPGTVRCAILDPELTLGLPPTITAATGMDAIAHCVETYCSPRINPPADAIALDGLSRAIANIEHAVKDGGNRDARWNMMMAAMEGALAFQKGMGAVHSVSHSIGVLKLHHGTLNAVVMPHVLRYNADSLGEKFVGMRKALNIAPDADVPDFFARLNERLDMPKGLGAMGMPSARIVEFAKEALTDSSHPTNPRPMMQSDYEKLITNAM